MKEGCCEGTPRQSTSERYASYWNPFLLNLFYECYVPNKNKSHKTLRSHFLMSNAYDFSDKRLEISMEMRITDQIGLNNFAL